VEGETAIPESPAAKLDEASDNKSVVGDLKFTLGALPKHNEMGFTPYFDKNLRELKGPIPLTIFNKMWKNAVILYHSKKRAKLEDAVGDRNRYTGYPYPSEWTQTFAEWTTNHQGFYNALVNKYGYHKFSKWRLAHKANADAILAEDNVMAALCYDIQIRTNCFAHQVTLEDGSKLIADISILRPKVASSTYATARKFNELEFTDNPYAENGPRASWDPTTGNPKTEKKQQSKQANRASLTTPAPNPSTSNSDKTKAKTPRGSRYQGSNYDPNFQGRQQERDGSERDRSRKP
jgi:hypothetical protein